MSIERANTLLRNAETAMGIKPSGGYHVTEEAARGLVKLLEGLHTKHPDLASKFISSPYRFDDRAQIFLDHVADRETSGGKAPSKELAVAYNLVRFIRTGNIDATTPFAVPSAKTPWMAPKQSDLFFNVAVYNDLNIKLEPHGPRGFLLTHNWVSHKALFNPDNPDKKQQQMIEEVARDLKITGVKLIISDEGRKVTPAANDDPKAKTYYSADTIARMATEIMARQAKAVCSLKEGEKGISDAIMSGRYMPHLADMWLAEIGLGTPPWDAKRLKDLREIEVINGDPTPADNVHRMPHIRYHQSTEWAKRFGVIDDKYRDEIAANKGTWARDVHLSPFSYYNIFNHGSANSRKYEDIRNNSYLPRLNWLLHNGLDLCVTNPVLSDEAPRAGSAPSSGNPAVASKPPAVPPAKIFAPSEQANAVFVCSSDKIGANAGDATGQKGRAASSHEPHASFVCPSDPKPATAKP